MAGTFDRKLFAELLELAIGEKRSMNQFAQRSGVAVAHVSRLRRAMLEAPPSPQIIQKFADVAINGVTYEQLMQAAGHIGENEEAPEIDDGIKVMMIAKEELSAEGYQELIKFADRMRKMLAEGK